MGLSISYPPDDYLPADDDNSDRPFVRSLSFDNLSSLETPDSPPEMFDAVSSRGPFEIWGRSPATKFSGGRDGQSAAPGCSNKGAEGIQELQNKTTAC